MNSTAFPRLTRLVSTIFSHRSICCMYYMVYGYNINSHIILFCHSLVEFTTTYSSNKIFFKKNILTHVRNGMNINTRVVLTA